MRNAALALLATVLLSPAAPAQPPTAWADKLFGSTLTHDFGVVPRGRQLKHAFKITNIYKVPLEITNIRVSCGCVTATPAVKVLQPNESTQLDIIMDSARFSGPKTVRLYLTVGPEYVSTATLTISANARQDVVFNPGEVDFGPIARGQTPEKYIDVEYAGSLDWRVSEVVKSSSAPFELRVEELATAVNGTPFNRKGYRIFARLKPDAPAGPFKQEVILKTNDPASPTLTFNVNGTVQATLTVSPSPLVVTGLRVGEMQTKKLLIRGSRPFRVTKVDGTGDGVTADVPNRQETTLILDVRVQPTRPGELRRQLVIHTDLDNESAAVTVEGDIAP
jgi:hypothetical protein